MILLRRFAIAILLVAAPLLFVGCEAASVMGDTAGSAITQVQALFHAGKLEVYGLVDWKDAIGSVRRAMDRLRLTPVREVQHPEQMKMIFRDDRDQKVTVTVVRRTSNFTELRVDVGLFGPEAMGRAVLRAIALELPKSALDSSQSAYDNGS